MLSAETRVLAAIGLLFKVQSSEERTKVRKRCRLDSLINNKLSKQDEQTYT